MFDWVQKAHLQVNALHILKFKRMYIVLTASKKWFQFNQLYKFET